MQENPSKSPEEIKELLETAKNGKPYSTIDNAAIIFREDPLFKDNLKNNLFRERIELTGSLPWPRVTKDVTDMDDVHIRHHIEKNYQLLNDKKIREGMQIVASENSYHPVREYLNSLIWDGEEHIRHILPLVLGAEPSDYTYECLRLFLLGAINRVFNPGCKFEYMLCLVGGQGAGKSSFIRLLASRDEWFCDDIKRLDDERIYEHLVGHWILEIPEMLALNNVKCNEATKAFLSRQYDNFRLPYGFRAEDRPRQCVFAGTSNIVHFLPNDRSGNRRFLPILCDASKAYIHILKDEQGSRKLIEQVWAEAMHIYRTENPRLKLPTDIEKNLAHYQEPFMQDDTWAELIKSFLEDYTGDIVCTQMLYKEALDMYGIPNKVETSQIMEIMSHIPDWVRFNNPRRFANYKRQKGWERVGSSPGNQVGNLLPKNDFQQISLKEVPFEH